MSDPRPETAPARLRRRTMLGGALAAVLAAVTGRRQRRARPPDPRPGQAAEPKRPIWIGHL
jgi:hypothetical protein